MTHLARATTDYLAKLGRPRSSVVQWLQKCHGTSKSHADTLITRLLFEGELISINGVLSARKKEEVK